MALDSGEYDITQFEFDEDTQDLADRTHRRLYAVFVRTNVSRDNLYYIAASAVECLKNCRADYVAALAEGVSVEVCRAGVAIGRADAHLYFDVARMWAAEQRSGDVVSSRRRREAQIERRVM